MSKKLSLFLTFITAAAVLVIAFKQTGTSSTTSENDVKNKLQDYSWQIFHSTSWQIDKAKAQSEQTVVYADAFHYHNDTQISQFTRPFITRYKTDEIITIESQQGQTRNEEQIDLAGQVQLQSFTPPTDPKPFQPPLKNKTLTSEQISYNSQTSLLTSDVLTQIEEPNLTISGVGFEANLDQGVYRFFSQVKTYYDPNEQTDKATEATDKTDPAQQTVQ